MDNPAVRLLSRLVLISIVIGTAMAAASTERVDLSLMVWQSLAWSFVPVIQLFTGLALTSGAQHSVVGRLTAYFDTHVPWSLWLLTVAAALVAAPPLRLSSLWLGSTVVVPIYFTTRALARFCRETLGMTRSAARRRVAVHQGLTWGIVLIYFSLSVALWPRIVGWLAG